MPVIHDDDAFEDDDEVLTEDDAPETVESESSSEDKTPDAADSKVANDDEEPYGKKVQKRISKLTGRMREMERETSFWRDKVLELESKTKVREMTDFQNQVEWSAQEITQQLEAARAAKKTAIEEGSVDDQIKADDRILELREQLAEKRRIATAAKAQADQFKDVSPEKKPPAPTTAIPENLPAGTQQWLRANPWFMQGDDPRAVEFARSLDAALQEEGYSPDEPTMYAELDKRLHVLVPRLAKPVKPPAKPRVAGSSTDGQRAESNSKPSRKLTTDDLTKMRRYGFDPNKPDHRKHWLHRNDSL